MFTVLTCIRQEHDLRFVVLAALICVVAAFSAFGFFRRARGNLASRSAWIGLTGLVGGSGIWATHFIAMLAYETKLNIHYDIVLTAISWVVAVAGVAAGFAVASRFAGLAGRMAGGALAGLGIGAMHFLGMAAVRLQGWILWRDDFVIASLLIGSLGAAAAFGAVTERPGWRRQLVPPLLFVLAIVGLHFTAMAAAMILPSNGPPLGAALIGRGVLASIVGALAAFIFAAAGSLVWMERFTQGSTFTSVRGSLDALPSGVAFFDRSERLLVWNRTFAAMLGQSVALSRKPQLDALLALAEAAHLLPGGAREVVRPDGTSSRSARCEGQLENGRWMSLEARPAADGGLVIILTDTTDANDYATTLAAARDAAEAANRAKTEFLANMSHEIRTPLNGVMGVAEALGRTKLTSQQSEMLQVVRECGEALDVLLGDILDLARVEAGEMTLLPEPVRLGDICESVAALFKDRALEKKLKLDLEIGAGAGARVLADPLRLRQVLTNLVSNAVKFTEAGSVTIRVERVGERFRVEVRDTGPGLDPALQERLFQRFGQADGSATRVHGGVGLGLPLCQRLASLMDAELGCVSTPGQGAVFSLEAGFAVVEEAPAADAGDNARPGRVLVVDDNAVNRKVLELILDSAGIEHQSAENGLEAVTAFKSGGFDAVLMDIQMPVMDGLEATRQIRRWEAERGESPRPLYIVSANCLPEHVAAGVAAGANGHLAKPVSAAKILGVLAQASGGAAEASRQRA